MLIVATRIQRHLALRLDVRPEFWLTLAYDDGNQKPAAYFGVPLISNINAIREKNYNVDDALIAYRDQWLRFATNYRTAEGVVLRNQFYSMMSNRHWRNSESYTFNAANNQITRSDYIESLHRVHQVGNRFDVTIDSTVADHENRFVGGVEVNKIDFLNASNTPYDGVSEIDAFDFYPGVFSSPDPTLPRTHSHTSQAALFAENRLEFMPRLAWVSGLRYDHIAYRQEQGQK